MYKVFISRMIWKIPLFLLIALVHVMLVEAWTNPDDFAALQALKGAWRNTPPNWVGSDPCDGKWDNVGCYNNRVISLTLANIGLKGLLPPDIADLSELQILDLSSNEGLTGTLPWSIGNLKKLTSLLLVGCGFYGPIPPSIGSLQGLIILSLNSNQFGGEIPPAIGSLSNLRWLDLSENNLSGSLPVSSGSTPGLDMLFSAHHFHLESNQFSGPIPPQLFSSNMSLFHLLLHDNQITGNIPSTLGLVQSLEIVRLDGNSLGGPIPTNINNLTSLQELYLSNNKLNGSLPDLTGLNSLSYLDMSNNTFDPTDFPSWLSSLLSLTSLVMDNTQIRGNIPESLFNLSELQTVSMKNNQINGTLNFGTRYSRQLQIVDLENNNIELFTQGAGYNFTIILVGNQVCGGGVSYYYCTIRQQPNFTDSVPQRNCTPSPCNSDQVSSPNCKCAYPYTGNISFISTSFSNFGNSTTLSSLRESLTSQFYAPNVPVDVVSAIDPSRNEDSELELTLQFFPSGQDHFNRSGVSGIAFLLNNRLFVQPSGFGPYYFIGNDYRHFDGGPQKSGMSIGIIVGVAVGGSFLVLLLVIAGVYACRQKKKADDTAVRRSNPFGKRFRTLGMDNFRSVKSNSGGVPWPRGPKSFTFEELRKATDNFTETNALGNGGYGKVYRGNLANGQLIAIKRAQQGSMQGGLEFNTEIELLSRVHHKNVVGLVGFSFDRGEQMLVYEYIPNGTLKDGLSGRSGIRLDWTRRLRVALGAARGLQYLHELANPPIIHRDVKSNNILLDARLNAKVADFGLSKPLGDTERDHVTTQVKGTMGYLDPEYYMTQKLTEKSDVYSFGVLLFELLTSRTPIERGNYIVREVKIAMDTSKEIYNLQEILDPLVTSSNSTKSIERFVDLAFRCVQESGTNRPTMGVVVKEIESVMELAGLNPNAESASTSASYEGTSSKGFEHPYSNESLFAYSGGHLPSKLVPK